MKDNSKYSIKISSETNWAHVWIGPHVDSYATVHTRQMVVTLMKKIVYIYYY